MQRFDFFEIYSKTIEFNEKYFFLFCFHKKILKSEIKSYFVHKMKAMKEEKMNSRQRNEKASHNKIQKQIRKMRLRVKHMNMHVFE